MKKKPIKQAEWLDEIDRALEDAARPTEGLLLSRSILADFAERIGKWLNQGVTREARVTVEYGLLVEQGWTHDVIVRFQGYASVEPLRETLVRVYLTLDGDAAIETMFGLALTPHVPATGFVRALLNLCRMPLFKHRIALLRMQMKSAQPRPLLKPTAKGGRHSAREIKAAVGKMKKKAPR